MFVVSCAITMTSAPKMTTAGLPMRAIRATGSQIQHQTLSLFQGGHSLADEGAASAPVIADLHGVTGSAGRRQ
jgi:hypothetical protein